MGLSSCGQSVVRDTEAVYIADTCGFEEWVYCNKCKHGSIHLCLDGVVRCPCCEEPVAWCPGCSDGAAIEAVLEQEENT